MFHTVLKGDTVLPWLRECRSELPNPLLSVVFLARMVRAGAGNWFRDRERQGEGETGNRSRSWPGPCRARAPQGWACWRVPKPIRRSSAPLELSGTAVGLIEIRP